MSLFSGFDMALLGYLLQSPMAQMENHDSSSASRLTPVSRVAFKASMTVARLRRQQPTDMKKKKGTRPRNASTVHGTPIILALSYKYI